MQVSVDDMRNFMDMTVEIYEKVEACSKLLFMR